MLSRVARVTGLAIAGWMAIAPAGAQTEAAPAVPFATRLEQARTTLQVDDSGLHGAGSRILADAVTRARYVMIGEDHLSREIPQFATGICRIMAPAGLRTFAVESGPEVADMVNGELRRPDRSDRIAAFLRAHPHAVAFQDSRDESDMAAQCAQMAGAQFRLWGLDQEFLGSGGYLLERMLAANPGPHARGAIEALLAFDRTSSAKALASRSIVDLFLIQVTDRQMADAAAAIAQDGGERVRALFDGLAETRAIYLGQDFNGFSSNGQRARLMKRTLLRYLDAGPQPGPILFKFGAVHAAKGFNALGQRDLGNFVAERADGEGTSSLHIAVYGARGVRAFYDEVGRAPKTAPFVLTDDPDFAWLAPVVPAQGSSGKQRDWTLLDLRALRTNPPADMPEPWRQMAQQFDLLVIAPELTPTSMLGVN